LAAKKKPAAVGATLLGLALALPPLLVAPFLIRGLAADAWIGHYAAQDKLPRPSRAAARTLIEKTSAAMWHLAPLPQASAAAIRALDVGVRVEHGEKDPEAAIVIYRGVREACVAVRDRPLSGAGFAVIEARAKALEDAALKAVGK